MKTTLQQYVFSRQPLSILGILTIVGLCGTALAAFFLLILIGQIILPILIVALVLLVVAALVATGIRWMPLLGMGDGLGTMIGGLVSQQYLPYHLTHPADVGFFTAALLMYVFGALAVVAGLSATVQNYRVASRRRPRWLVPLLTAFAGFVVGAILVAALSQSTTVASVASTTNGIPTVHMGVSNFTQSTVTIAKGSKLMLVDDGQFPHILRNGEWVGSTQHPASEAGAPLVNNLQFNGNSAEIGPFNTAGTYHIYCTIHTGMNLTVIVQ